MFIWKVGHALHLHHPTFRSVTKNDRIRDVCQKLGFRKPAIPQSMYIYKNTGIGGEGSYEVSEYDLSNSFVNTFHMFSISQTASGCQLFVHGTKLDHRFLDPIARCHHWEWLPVVHQRLTQGGTKATVNLIQTYLLIEWIILFAHFFFRFIRNADPNGDLLIYDRPPPVYADADFVPVPVKKGSLVLIHGYAVHKSDLNKSTKSRHAYTFHIMETDNTVYSKENWLQLPTGQSFDLLWGVRQKKSTETGDNK